MLLVSVILQTVGVNYGLGKHYDTLREENTIIQVSFYSYLAGFFPILATSWAKTSFALSLLRITTSHEMRWSIWAIIVVVNLVFASNGIIQWVQCWPIPRLWNTDLEGGKCLSPSTIQNFNIFVAGKEKLWSCVLGGVTNWKYQHSPACWISSSHSFPGRSSGLSPSTRGRSLARLWP